MKMDTHLNYTEMDIPLQPHSFKRARRKKTQLNETKKSSFNWKGAKSGRNIPNVIFDLYENEKNCME